MESVEAKIVEHLNFRCYRLHGDQLFSIAHTALKAEKSLIGKFVEGATASTTTTGVTQETIESVYHMLLSKICNARFNEFLRNISKLACLESKQVVDGIVCPLGMN